jgi:hypothetical protein
VRVAGAMSGGTLLPAVGAIDLAFREIDRRKS